MNFRDNSVVSVFCVLLAIGSHLVRIYSTPSLESVMVRGLYRLLENFSYSIISPNARQSRRLSLFVGQRVTVRRNASAGHACTYGLRSVFFLGVFYRVLMATLRAFPSLLRTMYPSAVRVLILPFVDSKYSKLILVIRRGYLSPYKAGLSSGYYTILGGHYFYLICSRYGGSSHVVY